MNRADFATFLRHYFPQGKVQKISINAQQTCPTRDGSKGRGGCTYCNNSSFSPLYTAHSLGVTDQIERGINFFTHKYPQMRYLAYFQSYTNTYGRIEQLIELYEEALAHPRIVGLIIGTRPDCMPEELLLYFKFLAQRTFVLIEYGIESTIDRTLLQIRRGHTYMEAEETIQKTHRAGILCGGHLILGLPGESRDEILSHADRLSALPINTLKLHQLQIIRGTEMARQYESHPEAFTLLTEDSYIDLCVDFEKRLRQDIVIERYVSQSPPGLVIAPKWGLKNYQFAERIRQKIRCKQFV